MIAFEKRGLDIYWEETNANFMVERKEHIS